MVATSVSLKVFFLNKVNYFCFKNWLKVLKWNINAFKEIIVGGFPKIVRFQKGTIKFKAIISNWVNCIAIKGKEKRKRKVAANKNVNFIWIKYINFSMNVK